MRDEDLLLDDAKLSATPRVALRGVRAALVVPVAVAVAVSTGCSDVGPGTDGGAIFDGGIYAYDAGRSDAPPLVADAGISVPADAPESTADTGVRDAGPPPDEDASSDDTP